MNEDVAFSSEFGGALSALKSGRRVARAGWNGKGMFLALQKGYPDGIACNENTAAALGVKPGATVRILPYIVMSTVDGSLVPWLASQTDILAGDWTVLPDVAA